MSTSTCPRSRKPAGLRAPRREAREARDASVTDASDQATGLAWQAFGRGATARRVGMLMHSSRGHSLHAAGTGTGTGTGTGGRPRGRPGGRPRGVGGVRVCEAIWGAVRGIQFGGSNDPNRRTRPTRPRLNRAQSLPLSGRKSGRKSGAETRLSRALRDTTVRALRRGAGRVAPRRPK